MKIGSISIVALFATALVGGASAFVAPAVNQAPIGSSQLYSSQPPVSTGYDSFERLKNMQDMPNGEDQRQLRRTVYTHDDWKKHRRQDRFLTYLAAIFKSGVYKNLRGEVVLVTGVATFACLWNAVCGGYTDFAGIAHDPIINSVVFPKLGLPLAAFTLTSPSLGLLLGTFVI
jgi:hypothetical protein